MAFKISSGDVTIESNLCIIQSMDFLTRELIPIKPPLAIYVGPTILQKSSIMTSSSIMHGPFIILDWPRFASGDIIVWVISLHKTV